MAKKSKALDPHADREASKYENPIPSREFIQQLLAEADQPLNNQQIYERLQLAGDEQIEALRRRLRAMERDGQLLVNRKGAYCLVDKMDLVRGRVQGHRDGYGFLVPLEGGDDLYLSARQMTLLFDGDEALARVAGTDPRGQALEVPHLAQGLPQAPPPGSLLQQLGDGLLAAPDFLCRQQRVRNCKNENQNCKESFHHFLHQVYF